MRKIAMAIAIVLLCGCALQRHRLAQCHEDARYVEDYLKNYCTCQPYGGTAHYAKTCCDLLEECQSEIIDVPIDAGLCEDIRIEDGEVLCAYKGRWFKVHSTYDPLLGGRP